eukprot:1159418-Pelagomonas_calceolata.AAC.7
MHSFFCDDDDDDDDDHVCLQPALQFYVAAQKWPSTCAIEKESEHLSVFQSVDNQNGSDPDQ